MTEHKEFTPEEMEHPQVMLWVDQARTNLSSYRDVPISAESRERSQICAQKAAHFVSLCGGFIQYWEKFSQQDNLARLYTEKYGNDALNRALTDFILRTAFLD